MDTAPSGNLLKVNGAKIYYEVRGSGPSVLFIAGATGDGGHFERVAELLSDEFTVVSYDRRGNSRSPRPEGWKSTSTEEQSADAAGLIEALGLAPAAVFGTSGGRSSASTSRSATRSWSVAPSCTILRCSQFCPTPRR